jgi:hypothetical protein
LSQFEDLRTFIGLPARDNPDLEELFTLFDLAALRKNGNSRARYVWPQVKPQIVRMITDAFFNRQARLHNYIYNRNDAELLYQRKLLSTLDAWASRVQSGDVIISFNWDIRCEVRLWLCNKWHYSDGYGFSFFGDKVHGKSPIKILKLHGSINWAQTTNVQANPWVIFTPYFFPSDSGREGETEFDDFAFGQEGRIETGQMSMVIPSYLKVPGEGRALLTLWNQAAAALRGTTELFVIGYRLYRADGLARYLFASSLFDNVHKPDIHIVSPTTDDDSWDDLCSLVGVKVQRHKQKFEDWVASA